VFLVLLLVATAFAGEFEYDEGVLVLKDTDFDQALQEFDFLLIEFYAPWCGHCKKLAPEYVQAASELAQSNPNVKLAKVDCTVEKDVCAKFEIKGFPTIKFFIKGSSTPILYEAGRTAPEIVQWLKKKGGPSSVHITSVEDAEKIISDNEVVGFFFGPPGFDSYTNFLSAANTFDVSFAHTDDEAVKQKYEVQGEALILFKKFDEGKNVHTGPFGVEEIREFINKHMHPTIIPFEQKAAQRIFGEGLDTIFLIRADDEAGTRAEEAFRAAANDLKGKITLSFARIEDALGGRLAEYIGVSRDNLPAIRVVQPSKNNQKFLFENEITADNIKQFVEDFSNSKLTPFFKSEPIPADPFDENVRIIVGKNYEDIVLDPNTDVLMEFYAPWCGHCKSLTPIYSAVAGRLKNVPGIVIAKMDSTANEVEGLSIQGFPTIKFYPKGNKNSPMDFSGERTEEGFIEFLRNNAGNPIPSDIGGHKIDPSLDEL